MIKNIFIPSFKTLEDGVTFMEETEYKTLFSVGINWDLWYDFNGVEKNNINQQKDSVIISNILPSSITTESINFQIDKWYYDGEFIFMLT